MEAIFLPQIEVEQDEVGIDSRLKQAKSFLAGGALRRDQKVSFICQQTAQAFAEKDVIVEQEKANFTQAECLRSGTGTSSTTKAAPSGVG